MIQWTDDLIGFPVKVSSLRKEVVDTYRRSAAYRILKMQWYRLTSLIHDMSLFFFPLRDTRSSVSDESLG
jgi:hypothetical protein